MSPTAARRRQARAVRASGPERSRPERRIRERQEPAFYAGWHHEWAPGSHTLFLFSRLTDKLQFVDPNANVLFLRQGAGGTLGVETPIEFEERFGSDFTARLRGRPSGA